MSSAPDPIEGLRDALRLSPENLPLRLHLSQTLSGLGRHGEAEQELLATLAMAPNDVSVKLALANAYLSQEKTSQAMVIVEDLVEKRDVPAAAYVLYARLLLREGDVPAAVAQYKLALEIDEEAADEQLGQQLGVGSEHEDGEVFEGRVRTSSESEGSEFDPEIERPTMTFADVGGMADVKEEISIKILYPIKHPEMYKAYGKTAGGGILMYGPPGCGKTYLARATAGEIGAGFISVGINDVLDMWSGQSERNLHQLFEHARQNTPCVLFFDEVDALGGRRSDMHSGSGRQLINQFLSEMDGVEYSNEGVLVLAATNAPWHVDPAFRRPGRFDQVLFVPPPDAPARTEVLDIHLRGKPQDSIDLNPITKRTDGYSGADMKAIVDLAIEGKLREAMKAGTRLPITTKDLMAAVKKMKPTTREWFSTARNYALYSNQGGVYDAVLKYLKLQ
jgi:ATP-dependent 26S proteasome regulatory subunit